MEGGGEQEMKGYRGGVAPERGTGEGHDEDKDGTAGYRLAGKELGWGTCFQKSKEKKKTTRLLLHAERGCKTRRAGPPWSLEPAAGLTAEDRTDQIGSSESMKQVPDGKAVTSATSRETPELARCTSKTATKCGCHYRRCS